MANAIATGTNTSFMEVVKLDHIVFKLDIYKAFIGYHTLSPEQVSSHRNCRLGKWYFEGRGHHECRGTHAYTQLDCAARARFTNKAARRCRLSTVAISDRATRALHEMERASVEVMSNY